MVKIVIIGGGFAGLSAATLLSEHPNFEIEIYEKEKEIGGQATSLYNDNCSIEHAWRVFGASYHNVWYIFKNILNITDELEPGTKNCIVTGDKVKPGNPKDTDLIPQIINHAKVGSYYKYTDMVFLSKERVVHSYDEVNALDYFDGNKSVNTIVGPYQGIESTKVSVSSALKNLYEMMDKPRFDFLKDKAYITKKPTSQAIFEHWEKHLIHKNISILKEQIMQDICIEKGKIKYVLINSKKVYADEFIFACSLKPLNQILEKKEPCDTFRNMKQLEQNLQLYFSFNVYFSKKLVSGCNHILLEQEAWVPFIQRKVLWPDEVIRSCTFNDSQVHEVWNIVFLDYVKGSKIQKILRECSVEEAVEEGLFQIKQNPYILDLMKKNNTTFDEVCLGYDIWHQFKNSSETFPVQENHSTPLSKIADLNPKFSPNQGTMKYTPNTHPKDLPENMTLCGYYVYNSYGGSSMESSAETGLIAADYILKKHDVINQTILPITHDHKYLVESFIFKPFIKLDEILYANKLDPITKYINSFYLLIFILLLYSILLILLLFVLFKLGSRVFLK